MNLAYIYGLLLLSTLSCGAKSNAINSIENSAPPKTINLKDYGAKGLGAASVQQDNAALRKAIADLNANGGGRLYVPNPAKFYAFQGNGIFVGDNVEIYGDGKGKSEIRNVDPTSSTFLTGPIFLFSTYGPSDRLSIFQPGVDQYPIGAAGKGDSFVVLNNAGNAASLLAGEVIVLGGGKFQHANDAAKTRFHNMELNVITSIKGNKIFLKYPLSVGFPKDKDGQAPVIVNINNTRSKNFRLGIENKTSKNIYIHDLTLTQAQTNEITGKPFSQKLTIGLSGVWQPGGALGSTFKNLLIKGYSGLGGNMFTHCRFENIDVFACKKLMDFGYGASNDTLRNINWYYLPSQASNFSSAFIIINDGTHNIVMDNITATGDFVGPHIIAMSQAKGIRISNFNINFPKYRNGMAAIQVGDKENITSENISFNNINISVGGTGQFLNMGPNRKLDATNRNIVINQAMFKGDLVKGGAGAGGGRARRNANFAAAQDNSLDSSAGNNDAITIRNINGLTFKNVSVSSGGLSFTNCDNSNFEDINAPKSKLKVIGTQKNTKFLRVSVSK